MEKQEATFWLTIMSQAQEGDEEARLLLNETDKARTAMHKPTIQEELTATAEMEEAKEIEEFEKHLLQDDSRLVRRKPTKIG